ncbi:hypothetical protein SCLCIDRAFT_61607, partial [Scleroderma citrinum Foug A]
DPTICSHLATLYNTLEQNPLCVIEPYSVIEINNVARQVGQGRQDVKEKLSQMILDSQGILCVLLDQGSGCLLIFNEPEVD